MRWSPLAGLTRNNLGTEALAGVTLLAIAVPLNIGYAQIAGSRPPPAFTHSSFRPSSTRSSCRRVSSSRHRMPRRRPSSRRRSADSPSPAPRTTSTLALAQAIICGVMFVLAAVFKLGFLANFLSKPILIGFVGGLALDILVSQVAKMLGVKIDTGGEFVDKVSGLVAGLADR